VVKEKIYRFFAILCHLSQFFELFEFFCIVRNFSQNCKINKFTVFNAFFHNAPKFTPFFCTALKLIYAGSEKTLS